MGESIEMQVLNLHDTFMNADLQREAMQQQVPPRAAEDFMTSPRGRFERTWIMFLYVLVEAWAAADRSAARAWIRDRVDVTRLQELLDEGDREGHLHRAQAVRHYMAHRDRRDYWDAGRLAVAGADGTTRPSLQYYLDLNNAFGGVLLDALNSA